MALKRYSIKEAPRERKPPGAATQRLPPPSRLKPERNGAEGCPAPPPRKIPDFSWANAISEEEWDIYKSAIETLRSTGVRFLLGGGFALATFTGRWRDTKDIDFYVCPRDREAVVAALTKAGFADYYNQRPYDRKWIHRSVRFGVIVDIIWSMANQRAQVDDEWFNGSISVSLRGEKLQVVPMEEFLWCKLYIMQRDHCDWTDIFNLVYANGELIDWRHLIERLKGDTPLLRAMLHIFGWLCPKQTRRLPGYLWKRLAMPNPALTVRPSRRDRIRLLDSRAWFAALLPEDRKLEV
jgi:hypothetical protein